ncbi:MAG: BNR-4 repeat-containing protein, partial [bacterium]|nr:BNR-4 repeat-containing protein [bacterium]
FILCSINSWAESKGNIMQTTVEYTTPGPTGFTLDEPYSSVAHFNNSTYYVWVDASFRPWITQTTNGQSTTVPIDPGTDYAAQADAHHRFSLGIDTDGYIHVTGDMHHYSNLSTAVITPYPVRYQKQTILYWKSNQAQNITGGFTFAGGLKTATAIPGGGWLLGRFFNDNLGTLYYSSQVHAFEGSNNNGQMAVGLYKYNTATKTWMALGNTVPNTINDPYRINIFPVFFWENSGLGPLPAAWFQNYQPQFKFDSANRMHFTVVVNTNPSVLGLNRVVYAVSDDAGITWKKANGTVISGGLPLRAIDGLASTADIVGDNSVSPFYSPNVGLAVDKNGKAGVSINNLWRIWDGQAWTLNTPQNTSLPPGMYGYRLPNNNLLMNASAVGKIIRAASFDKLGITYDYPSAIRNLDDYSIKTTGVIYGATDNASKTQSILKTEIISAPLPKGWNSKNISLNPQSYNGESGYLNGSFIVRTYGDSLDLNNDSFTYVYKKVSNDAVISARVSLPETYSSAGLMMRETLASNSKHVSIYINPRPDGKLASVKVRQTTNASPGGFGTAIPSVPYWLKIMRTGDLFTTYISADDINWTKIQSISVPMNKEIYIGLAVVSNGHKWYSETATYDNVSATINLK